MIVWVGEAIQKMLCRPTPREVRTVNVAFVDVVKEGSVIGGPNCFVEFVASKGEAFALSVAEVFGLW